MRRIATLTLITALAAVGTTPQLPAQGIYADRIHRPIRPTPTPPTVPQSRLVLEKHAIKADVRDGLASYRIDQTFRNPSSAQIEGVYLFPIPKDAIARGIHLTINGKEMAGEVLDADQARGIYREIVRKMRDPALLEFVDQGLLRASIFPIAPRAEVKVALEFATRTESLGDVHSLALPLRFAADAGAAIVVDVSLATSAPITTLYSPSHDVDIARDGDRKARISFEGSAKGGADRKGDFLLYYASSKSELGMSLLCQRMPAQDGHFVLVLSPRHDVERDKAAPRDLVFVLDRSGSMAGDKWNQAKAALEYGLGTLNPQDRFALISFATDVRAYKPGLVQANEEEIAGATAHLKQLRPAGGTNISSSIEQALGQLGDEDGRLRMVAFLTDGLPTIGEIKPEAILNSASAKKSDARIFAFGIGYDVNTFLLDRMSQDHKGTSAYITEGESLELRVSSFFAKVAEPVLVDPKLTFKGVTVHDVYPPKLPDLFAGESLVVTGRYQGDGHHAIVLSGTRAQGEHSYTTEATFAKEESGNSALPPVWASRKIGYLLNQIRLHGSNKELVDSVIALGKEYGIVTPYTAGLVVEEGMELGVASNISQRADEFRQFRLASADAPASSRARREMDSLGYLAGDAEESKKRVGRAAVMKSREIALLAESVAFDADAAVAQGGFQVKRKAVGERRLVVLPDAVIDLAYQPTMKDTMIEIETYSDAWFDLLAGDPSLRAVLSLGENVLFVKDGKAYWVHP